LNNKNDMWRKRAIRLHKRLVGRLPDVQITTLADELRLRWAEGVLAGVKVSVRRNSPASQVLISAEHTRITKGTHDLPR
jgi:hypothetical protein